MKPMHPTKKTPGFTNPTLPSSNKIQLKTELPPGWDLERIQRILSDYEPLKKPQLNKPAQPQNPSGQNMIAVPEALVPAVLELIEKYKAA